MDQATLMYFAMWHARCEILRHSNRESCILSTKIVCDLFNQLGHKAMPVTVDVIGMNQVSFEKTMRGEDPDISEGSPDFASRCKVDPDKEDPEGTSWPGHLLLIAGRWLFDPSADQFARPDRDFIVRPMMVEFESDEMLEAWLYEGLRQGCELPDGGVISYEAHPDVVTYRVSSDWEDSKAGDGLWESVMAKTHGLIDLYQDVDELPDLPELPPSRSSTEPITAETIDEMAASVTELGYGIHDLVKREKDERVRVQKRKAALAQRRGQDIHRKIERS
jgi:hypothetical protein